MDIDVTRAKLDELLAVGTEHQGLDYKATVDLSAKPDKVELIKDIGAFMDHGGYIVIGADDHGAVVTTGGIAQGQEQLFDEANLRKVLEKYIPTPFQVVTKIHDLGRVNVGLIQVFEHPDGVCVFRSDGAYGHPRTGEQVVVFRESEMFTRHGTSSERVVGTDVARIRRKRAPAVAPQTSVPSPAGTVPNGAMYESVLEGRPVPHPTPAAHGFNVLSFTPRTFHVWGDDTERLRLDVRVVSAVNAPLVDRIDSDLRRRFMSVLTDSQMSALVAGRYHRGVPGSVSWRWGGGANGPLSATAVADGPAAARIHNRAVFAVPSGVPAFVPGAALLLDARLVVGQAEGPESSAGQVSLDELYWLLDAALMTGFHWWQDTSWVPPGDADWSFLPVGILLSAAAGRSSKRLAEVLSVDLDPFPESHQSQPDFAYTSRVTPDKLEDRSVRRDVITAGLERLLAEMEFMEPERLVTMLPT